MGERRQGPGGDAKVERRQTVAMADYREQLELLAQQGLRRSLRVVETPQGARVRMDGREVVCLCSNNYLGLANHPRVAEAARRAIAEWGWGSGASRLVSGTMTPHRKLEDRLARFKGTEAALVFGSGYQANLSAIRAAASEGDVILLDKLNHASIIDAARSSGATVRVFPHRGYDRLCKLLDRCGGFRRRLIVTDSVFSMDGDFADLCVLAEIKHRYHAVLCIDEAHATGVFGARGRGVAEQQGVEEHVDIVVGTLSKALGGIGGFVCASRDFVDYLVNTGRAFLYTTAPPPAACAAAEAALDLVEAEPQRRHTLLALAAELRTAWSQRGYDIAGSESPIVPLVVGDAERAVRLAEALLERGFLAPAIRPPTVPRGRSRLRVSLCAEHEPSDVRAFVAAADECLSRL